MHIICCMYARDLMCSIRSERCLTSPQYLLAVHAYCILICNLLHNSSINKETVDWTELRKAFKGKLGVRCFYHPLNPSIQPFCDILSPYTMANYEHQITSLGYACREGDILFRWSSLDTIDHVFPTERTSVMVMFI